MTLLPEVLLHSRDWSDVPNIIELSRAEMQWLVASANVLQPLGNARFTSNPPDRCFQSGQNLYCADIYELASVSHYRQQRGKQQVTEARDIVISYKQFLSGIVEDVRVEGSQRQVKVGEQWYHAETPRIEIFHKVQKGSVVHFITYGCTSNEKACIAAPGESKSAVTEQ